jgi:hypothetical protein
VSTYKTDQCRLVHRGKEFHFVSYEGHGANPAKNEIAVPAMWCLMMAGRRHEVMPQLAGQEESDRDHLLTAWLESNAFGPAPVPPRAAPRRRSA